MPTRPRSGSAGRRRRLARLLLAGGLLAGGAACAEQRPRAERDSSTGGKAGEDPEVVFRARRGRTWELARLGNQELPPTRAESAARRPGTHPGPGTRPTIRFTSEPATDSPRGAGASRAGGWSFCNGYGAAYELGPGDRLRFHQFQSTLVGCNGPDSLETRFFRALYVTQRFELGADTLVLIAADGSRLTFVASSDSAGARPD